MTTSSIAVIFDGYWITTALFMGGYLFNLNRAWRRLQMFHPGTWEELGRPGFYNIDPGAVFGSRKFLWSDKCVSLGDAVLLRHARLARICVIVSVTMFVLFAGLFIVASIARYVRT
jgi:hypothetical protein